MEAETADRANSPLLRLATEESITLRGIISPDYPTVDQHMLERLIAASQTALTRQIELLRTALQEHQQSQDATLEAAPTQARSLKRLEPMLEHTARLVHESQVLQRLRGCFTTAEAPPAHWIENPDWMVGAEGFEPPTLCSQSRCATRLRHAPPIDAAMIPHGRELARRIDLVGRAQP